MTGETQAHHRVLIGIALAHDQPGLLGTVHQLHRAVVADQQDPVMSLSVLGGPWRDVRVVEISDQRAVVDMCQCTGELVEQRGSNDPIVLECLVSIRRPTPSSVCALLGTSTPPAAAGVNVAVRHV